MRYEGFCNDCEADFEIIYEMDTKAYKLSHCPFCGTGIEDGDYSESTKED